MTYSVHAHHGDLLSSQAPMLRADWRRSGRRWRPSLLTLAIVLSGVLGSGVLLYPTGAAWLSQYNQAQVIQEYEASVEDADPSAEEQLAAAREYNAALTAGVELEADSSIPTGTGTSASDLVYNRLLSADATGLMARVVIPRIGVDLPIYHGTDDETLLRGVGHLQGSHLPIGGQSTHSVLTAHRGLASARMFTDLDAVAVGDIFTIDVFGEVLTYQVTDSHVVAPGETDSLRAVQGRDLVTLVTCTPLGINTHRILVTGERITPTPQGEIDRIASGVAAPAFPWWIPVFSLTVVILALYLWRAGYADARSSAWKRLQRDAEAHRPGSETDAATPLGRK